MADIYSDRLLAGTVRGGTDLTSSVVPTGFKWVLRYVSCQGAVAAGRTVIIFGDTSPGPLVEFDVGTGFEYKTWEGRIVLLPGERLLARASAGAYNITVNGYRLGASPE